MILPSLLILSRGIYYKAKQYRILFTEIGSKRYDDLLQRQSKNHLCTGSRNNETDLDTTLTEDEWTGHLLEDMKSLDDKLFVVTYTRDSEYKQRRKPWAGMWKFNYFKQGH